MGDIVSSVQYLSNIINGDWFLYSFLAIGLYFTVRTNFVQIRLLKPMLSLILEMDKSDRGISSYQALCAALAGRLGMGKIAGVATAIFYGGPGALFWMWVTSFLGAASAYMESSLAQLYKIELDGEYRGGPGYYILYGIKIPWFAMLFSFTIVIGCILACGIQSQNLATAFQSAMGVDLRISGGLAAVMLALIIFGGIRRIAAASEMVVPFMAIIYVLMSFIVIIVNVEVFTDVLRLIFRSALGADAMFGALLGQAVYWGIRRGIYSSEAGQGTQPHSAAVAEVSHPAKQGLVQALSVYIDTIVSTATGFMLLMTNCYNVLGKKGMVMNDSGIMEESIAGADGATFVFEGLKDLAWAGDASIGSMPAQEAVSSIFPAFGTAFVAVCLALFAFTTIMSYYYLSETGLAFMLRKSKGDVRSTATFFLRIFAVVVVFLSSTFNATFAWDINDICQGLMAWLNLLAILILQNKGLLLLKDYNKQIKMGKDPIFNPADYPEWDNIDIWKTIHAEYSAKLNRA
ncbi:MAG: alanine:cation symporter family protein [Clostridiales bacterium]|nr:alanine:cation symporter family protein [Clostridiales bacterium]